MTTGRINQVTILLQQTAFMRRDVSEVVWRGDRKSGLFEMKSSDSHTRTKIAPTTLI